MISTQGFRAGLLAAVVAAASALGLAGQASAQAWHHGHGDGDVLAIMHRLDLSAQQKQQIHALLQANRQATEGTRQQLRSLHAQLANDMFSTGSVSSASVLPLLQQEEQLRATLDQARLSTALSVRDLLTASQLQEAASLHAQLAALHQREHALMAPPQGTPAGQTAE